MSESFREYKQLDFKSLTDEIRKYWEKNDIFQKSIHSRKGNPSYIFYEGPPSANGMPGIHHVMSRTIKDIFCRYHTLKGKQVKRKAGWDTHGLPIELGVEKELGITKEDIGQKISVADYNEACRSSVMRYTEAWNELTDRIGFWVDLDNPYITYEAKYMESLWWLLKRLYQKGWLYKGYTIQPYSPAAGTGLSSHELNLPGAYKDITDTTIVAQFKAKKETLPQIFQTIPGDVYFLAWTTTPWTLPANTALTVGTDIEYVVVSTYNQYTFSPMWVVLARDLVGKLFSDKYFPVVEETEWKRFQKTDKKIPYFVMQAFKGKELIGSRYEQLLPWALPYQAVENAFQVISGDFITITEGTGIVHTAPTFGSDDAIVAKQYGVPPMLVLDEVGRPVPLVDLQGRFIKILPKDFAGQYVRNEYYKKDQAPERSGDLEIAILLKAENKAFKIKKYTHTYPHCWRTEKPILYYPLDSWFIKTTAVKERMIALFKAIRWIPKAKGKGRFGHWLENLNDWNLSRSRYWGVPLPIWRTEEGDEECIIGSVEELIVEIEKAVRKGFMIENPFKDFVVGDMSPENYQRIDLHKHVIDQIILVSPSGRPMKREADLIDVWFDSGAMPYAALHYPFENKELVDQRQTFPADFIAEGVDQTRGWFYTLHAIACMLFDSFAFRNVISNGLVLDKSGQKMSKNKGNTVNPFEILETYGSDSTRWYMIANAQPWENLRFDVEGIDEVKRKYFGTLYNIYAFFALYANVDGFRYKEADIPLQNRTELDRWILSELHNLIRQVDDYYANYNSTRAARSIADFVTDDLSNWYVRLCRRRFWKGDYTKDKIAAYQTLYTCLFTIAKLAAPIAPFFMDRLYQDLDYPTKKEGFESVHLAYFPKYDIATIDQELGKRVRLTQQITSMVFSLRKKENIRVRQPLQKLMILAENDAVRVRLKTVFQWIAQEVNVKKIELLSPDQASAILVKHIKPGYKILGPKLGKGIKQLAQAMGRFTQEDIHQIEQEGGYIFSIGDERVYIALEEVEITTKDIKGWSIASSNGLIVALDIHLTETLQQEGLARSLVNRIQHLRKQQGFEVTDKIVVRIDGPLALQRAVEKNKNYICEETLALDLFLGKAMKNGTVLDLEGHQVGVFIQKKERL
ncbi:MAG: isoleucine--tRNA ligase [Flavobacteriales bacterium AspAUS03]